MKYEAAKKGYRNLWEKATIRPDKWDVCIGIAKKLSANKDRYHAVSRQIGCPWWFVAITHQMESGARFDTHLHNGNPLTGRTYDVPSGRPAEGSPPFTWEYSALDALVLKELHRIADWPLERCLYEFERFNGFGYVKKKVNSPYVWSYTSLYTKGKFIRDHVYSSSAVSKQAGAAALLKALIEIKAVNLNQKETSMSTVNHKVQLFAKIAPTLAVAMNDPDTQPIAFKALAEKLEVEATPDAVSAKMEAISLLELVPLLGIVEELISAILPVDKPTPAEEVISEENKSPIDNTFGLTGYKTIIGLGIGVVAWVLSGIGVISPDMATIGMGLGVFIGGAGAKAWLDRLGISKKSIE